MQGAPPLASPGLNGARHWLSLRCRKPKGGAAILVACLPCHCGTRRGAQGFWSPADLATVVPGGERRGFGRLLTLPLAYFPAPIPPAPFPSGEGGDFRLFYARGFAPCIPGAGRGAALAEPAVQETEGGRGDFGRLPTLPLWYPAGVLAFFVARLPFYFSLLSCPHPPSPLPLRGRGRLKVILCKGLRPLHPRGWTGRGTGFSCGKRVPLVITAVQGIQSLAG